MKYLKQNAGCTSWCTRWARRPHAEKVLSASLLISRKSKKNLMPRSFTFVCQLYCCSSKHNNKAWRITFQSCQTGSTSSMALATVNIDKIIKVTSASSYLLSLLHRLTGSCAGLTAGSLMFAGAVLPRISTSSGRYHPLRRAAGARDSQGYTRFATFMVAAATD